MVNSTCQLSSACVAIFDDIIVYIESDHCVLTGVCACVNALMQVLLLLVGRGFTYGMHKRDVTIGGRISCPV